MAPTTGRDELWVGSLPIPTGQFFYADSARNPQIRTITPMIDLVHYPTLGCPALLGPTDQLQVLLSLPPDANPAGASFRLVDRHGGGGAHDLQRVSGPEELAPGPGGLRKLYRLKLGMDHVPFALFDLHVSTTAGEEIQYNAVRRYQQITGSERVVLCGDSQYHVDNRRCVERFIDRVNMLDVAWIALIGDVCDNGVKGPLNLVKLGANAGSGPVVHYYDREYREVHELLRTLRHPVFLVPGNHDGMSAFASYDEGNDTDVYTGADDRNAVEYDGLHHYRRTFGPLYYRFDWGGTRYLCTNTFELTRGQRLGYHAIVANWGGWMRNRQLDWVKGELAAAGGMRKVMLMHHDPRGGSKGTRLGLYHRVRPYAFDQKWPILKSYIGYALKHGRGTWQQEWMAPKDGELADHPVRGLLRTMLEHEVWAVAMGHDNENWVDSYFEGDDLFQTEPSTVRYATRAELDDGALVDSILDCLEESDFEALHALLEDQSEETSEAALSAALSELAQEESAGEIVYSASPAEDWGLDIKSAIHFVHVDDVGAYKHSKESHFDDYGFVLARLHRGAPVEIMSHRITGRTGASVLLEED